MIVDITLRLHLEGLLMRPEIEEALRNLADVMGVQAEDGLYSLGSPDAEDGTGSNEYLADVEGWEIHSVTQVEDEVPVATAGARSTCSRCQLDIESLGDAGWWDRGGNGSCPDNIGGFHTPVAP